MAEKREIRTFILQYLASHTALLREGAMTRNLAVNKKLREAVLAEFPGCDPPLCDLLLHCKRTARLKQGTKNTGGGKMAVYAKQQRLIVRWYCDMFPEEFYIPGGPLSRNIPAALERVIGLAGQRLLLTRKQLANARGSARRSYKAGTITSRKLLLRKYEIQMTRAGIVWQRILDARNAACPSEVPSVAVAPSVVAEVPQLPPVSAGRKDDVYSKVTDMAAEIAELSDLLKSPTTQALLELPRRLNSLHERSNQVTLADLAELPAS